jgi:hypothetical protein
MIKFKMVAKPKWSFYCFNFFELNFGNYRYLPVFSIEVLSITGITVFEKVGIFAIPIDIGIFFENGFRILLKFHI